MKTMAELEKLKEEARKNINMRYNKNATRIQVGMGTCGIAAGARRVLNKFLEEIKEYDLKKIMVTQVGCMGECAFEPLVEVLEESGTHTIYCRVTERMVEDIIEEHIIGGKPIEKYILSVAKR